MLQKIKDIETQAKEEIGSALGVKEVGQLRVKYLGRKGLVTQVLRELGKLPPEQRPTVGREANRLKGLISELVSRKLTELKERETFPEEGFFDITLPGRRPSVGHKHPLTQVTEEIIDIFYGMGFSVVEGPEVELDYYNFEALNIPIDHPARDMHDTFYLDEGIVLRTHTSPVQIRIMEKQTPPVRIISPGRCFRKDAPDATHSPVFHQVEGLYIDRGVTFGDLKGVITHFAQQMFGPRMKIRFRPSYFPFTEPSAEYDFLCLMCEGAGCRVCKGTGWLEISGAGMVDPVVFGFVGYDPEEFSGYAFGMGVERIAMLKYGIDDMRLFFENNLRFLEQF